MGAFLRSDWFYLAFFAVIVGLYLIGLETEAAICLATEACLYFGLDKLFATKDE